jgi:hypothetical protein
MVKKIDLGWLSDYPGHRNYTLTCREAASLLEFWVGEEWNNPQPANWSG